MIKNFVNEKLIIALSLTLSILATYYSYTHNIIVSYNDAAAHLNTARRIIDSLTPGLVQIGSVWLPLLHVLELPFVANTFLWKTGLAGAIVSGISFVVSTIYLYKLSYLVTKSKWASFASVIVFVGNLNLLYLQTTAMFEPLLMATAIPAAYYLTLWLKAHSLKNIILTAFFIMLATLTRYDGWGLFLAAIVIIFIGSYFSKIKSGKEGAIIIFVSLAGFGVFLWFLYNLMIFSDPLYFANSEFSARAQQVILEERGQLPTKKDIYVSLVTYSLAMIVNNGLLLVGGFILGLLIYLINIFRKAYYLGPLLLTIPFFFNVVSLYFGQSVIWMPMIPPHFETYFNARYGILMLPAIAFFIGVIVSKSKWFFIPVVFLVLTQIYLFLNPSIMPILDYKIGIITLQDTVSSINKQTIEASAFLREHHKEGELILVSSASADAFIFRVGIPLKNFITEGTGYYWRNSLGDPRRHAKWIVFFNDMSDRVGKNVGKKRILTEAYEKVYEDTTYQIWRIK